MYYNEKSNAERIADRWNSSFFYESIAKELSGNSDGSIPRKLWGYELIISMEGCSENIIMNLDMVKEFVLNCVNALKMQPVGEPIKRFFKDADGVGCSVIQLLTSSHVATHTDKSKFSAFVDIFSCEYYNPKDILPLIEKSFNPKKIEHIFVLRNPGTVKVVKG